MGFKQREKRENEIIIRKTLGSGSCREAPAWWQFWDENSFISNTQQPWALPLTSSDGKNREKMKPSGFQFVWDGGCSERGSATEFL